jgi:hypothetical protein
MGSSMTDDEFWRALEKQLDAAMREMAQPRWLIANPPPAAKRTEGHLLLCRVNRGGDCNCTGLAHPVEQPAPAKFEPPECDRCPSTDGVRGHPVDGRYRYMCPPCIAAAVAWFSVQPGKSYKGPALIDRRLAHSPMWPDDDGGA